MIDRSVISKKHPDAVSMSKDEINTLKLMVTGSHTIKKPFGYRVNEVFRSIIHFCTFRAGSVKSPQCKTYGHTLPRQRTAGEQIFCGDCGKKITAPEQLRRPTSEFSVRGEVNDGSWKSSMRK